jgi:hypothetical protein
MLPTPELKYHPFIRPVLKVHQTVYFVQPKFVRVDQVGVVGKVATGFRCFLFLGLSPDLL